ncbi:hypothetical protein JD844_002133 [Phrynosoma platyrhinos]|uniref:PEHE domain-containing protein n=1 Tax=Phrynosoma platyrhinos TaxID=52577 RepID=A0ABQ7TB40_PHRPL|nr:hypothetical protein JD844_002133 [Phrynosoma platyrhinos]
MLLIDAIEISKLTQVFIRVIMMSDADFSLTFSTLIISNFHTCLSFTVPSWRDHTVEPLRDLNPSEIVENLDDSVFSKRHAKLELDEKRRKRWDIQRIREQRILQRLQLRMYKKKGIQESEPEVTSFFPESDDVESLMITPYLPVVAFGRPLPKLIPQ